MCGCDSWTVKKAECWRIDAFELWCWRRLLRVPWTARRSSQSILRELSLGCSLVGLMLKLKLQYFGHLMWRADSFEKTLMLGKIEGRRRRGRQRMRWLDGITDSMDMGWGRLGVGYGQGGLVCCGSWGRRVRHNWATEMNWNAYEYYYLFNLHFTLILSLFIPLSLYTYFLKAFTDFLLFVALILSSLAGEFFSCSFTVI